MLNRQGLIAGFVLCRNIDPVFNAVKLR